MTQDRVEPSQDAECFLVEHDPGWWTSQWVEGPGEARPPIRCTLTLVGSSTVRVYEGKTLYGASLAGHLEEGQHLQSLQHLLGEMANPPDPRARRPGVLAWVKWSYLERRLIACLDKPIDTLRADWQRATHPPPFSSAPVRDMAPTAREA